MIWGIGSFSARAAEEKRTHSAMHAGEVISGEGVGWSGHSDNDEAAAARQE